MFQNLCRSRRSTCRMPVSLSEWRVRIGTYVPRMPLFQYHNFVRYLMRLRLFLALLKTLADGESNVDPSEEQEMGSTCTSTTEPQSSTDVTPSKPEKQDSSCGCSDEQETPTAISDNTKNIPCKTSKKRKRHSQKGRDGSGQSAFLSFRCFMKSGASPLLRFLLLVFTTILLVRSGDVEMNPGPNETTVPDGTLLDIAKRIPQDKINELGVKIGMNLFALRRYRATNTIGGTVTWNGTLDMLVDWRDKTKMHQQKELLRNALNESSLQAVAEEYLPEAPRANPSSGPFNLKRTASGIPVQSVQDTMDSTSSTSNASLPMTSTSGHTSAYVPHNPSVLSTNCNNPITDKCIADIKDYYRVYLCQVPTSPLDLDSIVQLQCIFTNLSLLNEGINTTKNIPLKYKDLLNVDINGVPAKRIMIQGEAGVGKTTFCAKIAWDWVTGEHYQDYTLVAVVPLRDAKNGKTVGQVLKTYLPDDNNVTSEQLDEYIKTNQHKVLTVFDGFDEFGVEMSHEENEIVQILQGVKHTSGRVIVTTRPWKAHEIANGMNLKKQYAFVKIEGFKPKDVKTYVTKFYRDDKTSADTLLEFMEEGSLVTEAMAPFPIFCSMLCHMWKEVERREVIQKLQTFSQLFREMIVHLKEHYISKQANTLDDSLVQGIKEKIDVHFKKISDIAFNGLINDKLAFLEQEFESCFEDLRVAFGVGLLTREKTISKRAHGAVRKVARLNFTFSFPHKLFQEYIAAVHLEDLFNSHRGEFDRIMKNTILPKPTQYKYLLFFTGSFNNIICKDILKRMIQENIALDLIVEVAFEGHSEEAANVIEEMQQDEERSLTIKKGTSFHVISGYMFTLKNLVSIRLEGIPQSKVLSRNLAEKVCSLQSLTKLELVGCNVPVSFSENLQRLSEDAMVETFLLDRVKVTKNSAINLAKCICSLPHLNTFQSNCPTEGLKEDFFSALQSEASQSKLESLELQQEKISESTSQTLRASICAMPCLKNVKLLISLADGFYSAFREGASTLKLESLELQQEKISESASQTLGASICAMPCLKNVKLSISLADGFYSALGEGASTLKLESLELQQEKISESASQTLGASICAMPCLKNVKLSISLADGFYSALGEGASTLKLESLELQQEKISESASQKVGASICAMPFLKNVKLSISLADGFYSALGEGASTLKVESLQLHVNDISVHGSQSLGASICSMPCLRSVNVHVLSSDHRAHSKITLRKDVGGSSSSEVISSSCQINIRLKEEQLIAFVSSLASSQTPCVQVESLELEVGDIGVHGSQSLCASICSMPCLRSVSILCLSLSRRAKAKITLRKDVGESSSSEVIPTSCQINLKLEGELIITCMSSLASSQTPSVQVESLEIDNRYCDISESASPILGASICAMPCLKEVKINASGNLSDGFYSALREGASSLKIKQMHLMGTTFDSHHLSTIALMPTLKSLTLFDIEINDRNHPEEEGRDPSYTHASASLTELNVDHDSFISLYDIGLLKRLPCIQKMTLAFHGKQTPFSQQLYHHHVTMPDVTDLSLHGYCDPYTGPHPLLAKLSLESFPNLINLSLINIKIGNDNCTTILDSLRNMDTLKTISIKGCETDEGLDSLCNEINAEGNMSVTVEYGRSKAVSLRRTFDKL